MHHVGRIRTTAVLLALAAALVAAPAAVAVDNPDFRTLINDVAAIEDVNTRPLLATANASEAAFLRGETCAALGALGALENQLAARFVDDPNIIDDPNIRAVVGDIAGIRAVLTVPDAPDMPACVAPDVGD